MGKRQQISFFLKFFVENLKKSEIFSLFTGNCLPDDGNVTCSTATALGASGSPVKCPTNSATDGKRQYSCKRHAYSCLCSKWFEPVFRTFNGEDVPVENNAAYTLFSSPSGNFSVAIVLIKPTLLPLDDDDRVTGGDYYAPDKWPTVSRVSLTFMLPNSTNQTVIGAISFS